MFHANLHISVSFHCLRSFIFCLPNHIKKENIGHHGEELRLLCSCFHSPFTRIQDESVVGRQYAPLYITRCSGKFTARPKLTVRGTHTPTGTKHKHYARIGFLSTRMKHMRLHLSQMTHGDGSICLLLTY